MQGGHACPRSESTARRDTRGGGRALDSIDHATADPDHSAPGALHPGARRPCAAATWLWTRRAPAALRRCASPDHARPLAAIIFGGPMNYGDDFIRAYPLDRGPAQGGQAIPRHLPRGADVRPGARRPVFFPDPAGQAEIGYYPIRPTAAGACAATGGTSLPVASRRISNCREVPSFSAEGENVPGTGVSLRAATRCNSIRE